MTERFSCGDGIEFGTGEWSFNSDVCEVFHNHAIKSIPGYKDVHSMVSNVCKFICSSSKKDEIRVLDIGCSLGEFEESLLKNFDDTRIHITAIDSSEEMIKRVVFRDERVSYVCGDAIDYLDAVEEKYDVIVCLYTCQFFSVKNIMEFPIKLREHLKSDGILFLADKFEPSNKDVDIAQEQCYFDFKLESGYTMDEILGKKRALQGVQHRLKEGYILNVLNLMDFEEFKILDISMNFMCVMFYNGSFFWRV
jgi:tRNA (cmo5U34)-methyltransferase